jgi:geranylgeranyl reductase
LSVHAALRSFGSKSACSFSNSSADSHSCPLVLLLTAEADGPITLHYNKYVDGSKIGTPATVEVDMVIGADGANSRVAKEIDAGEYDYAIAFQERIRIPGERG